MRCTSKSNQLDFECVLVAVHLQRNLIACNDSIKMYRINLHTILAASILSSNKVLGALIKVGKIETIIYENSYIIQ